MQNMNRSRLLHLETVTLLVSTMTSCFDSMLILFARMKLTRIHCNTTIPKAKGHLCGIESHHCALYVFEVALPSSFKRRGVAIDLTCIKRDLNGRNPPKEF